MERDDLALVIPSWARVAGMIGLYLVTTIAAGDTIHYVGHVFRVPLSHHSFHLVFSVGALGVFAGFVLVEIRRHGWSGFSWRL